MTNILVIVYKFPPMGGVGTRRWAKFAKYLAKNGYKVHILTSYYPYTDKLTWNNDINSENIIIHTFKSKYPNFLLKEFNNKYINKIKRYTQYFLSKTLFTIDNAQYDAYNILSKAKEIILANNIKNVIASGHPVSINYISTYLKIDMPFINLIQDYRDNWNDLEIYQFGNKNGVKSFQQKEKIAFQEFFTLNYSDYIINVSDDLTNALKNKHKNLEKKIITITNGYDEDDFLDIVNNESTDFSIIYAGSLFNHRIDAINLLLDGILKLNDDFINENLKIYIYSNYDSSRLNNNYRTLINKNIFFYNLVSPEEILKIVSKKEYCLSINSKFASYAFGTKIFDYMGLDKKIIHISEGGQLFDLLKAKKQFVCRYDLNNIVDTLLSLKEDFLSNKTDNITNFDDFKLENLSRKLELCFV